MWGMGDGKLSEVRTTPKGRRPEWKQSCLSPRGRGRSWAKERKDWVKSRREKEEEDNEFVDADEGGGLKQRSLLYGTRAGLSDSYPTVYVVQGRAKPVLHGQNSTEFHHVPSWRNHIQGWMTLWQSYSHALEQGPLPACIASLWSWKCRGCCQGSTDWTAKLRRSGDCCGLETVAHGLENCNIEDNRLCHLVMFPRMSYLTASWLYILCVLKFRSLRLNFWTLNKISGQISTEIAARQNYVQTTDCICEF